MKKAGKKKIILLIALAAAAVIGVLIAVSLFKKAASYDEAIRLAQAGDTEAAYRILSELGDYRNAGEEAAALVQADPALPYRILSKGETLTFGSCEQDNDLSNGSEPIEWYVLDKIDDEILLLSVSCLDCRTYNSVPFEPVTWEKSEIRKWLNEDFYSQAFSDEEKQFIMPAKNINSNQSALGTNGGADTEDYVFLLSETEAGIYIGDEMDQEYIGAASATEYAAAQGAHTEESGRSEWWLRSPGAYEYSAQFVETDGSMYIAGAYVDITNAVRPAIWLKTKPAER